MEERSYTISELKKIKIIKEYCPEADKYVIRMNTYTSELQHLNNLADFARADFGTVGKIDVKQYAGRRYKGTFGIEFRVVGSPRLSSYKEIDSLEFVL